LLYPSSGSGVGARFDAGSHRRHVCGRMEWCGCGRPFERFADGRWVEVGNINPHHCDSERIERVAAPEAAPAPIVDKPRPQPITRPSQAAAAIFDIVA